MPRLSVIIVGSGAGGSVAAWALAKAGHHVLVLEKGRNLQPGIGTPAGIRNIPFANDEVRGGRAFENQDATLEPRTARSQSEAAQGTVNSFIGDVNDLPTTVGGGTVHWDAKVPRFWRQDFKGLSTHGPVRGANIADWPLTYEDLAPFYDEVEAQLGVQGDVSRIAPGTLAQAPRSGHFPLPPNPPMLAGQRLAEGARRLGYTAYPVSMAVNSQPFQGRPRCNSCGFCSGYGCPILARGSAAVSFLHPALLAGTRLRTRCMVHRVDLAPGGRRAVGVSFRDEAGVEQHERADVVIMAASAMETPRLALLSANVDHPDGLGNRSGQLGRNIMFHLFSLGVGIFADDLHAWRGPSSVLTIDDFVGPDTSAAAKATGMPFLKGGVCETGGGSLLLGEAGLYTAQANMWGKALKELMRSSPLRVHLAGLSMVGEDLPQEANRVDLDPKVRDVYGLAVPRITHSAHPFEMAAANYFGPRLGAICAGAPGVVASGWLPVGNLAETSGGFSSPYAGPASTAHIMGTARMGDDPIKSVVDPWGRMHDLDNVYVADGSVFTSSGGFNPTLTIMALALRMARRLGGPPLKGGDNDAVEIGAVAAGAAVLTAGVVAGGLRVRRRAAEQRVTQQD